MTTANTEYLELEQNAAAATDLLQHRVERDIAELCNANLRMTKALLQIVKGLTAARHTSEVFAVRDIAINCLQINSNMAKTL